MTSPIDQKWHMLSRSNTNNMSMEQSAPTQPPATEPKIELTINTKSKDSFPGNDKEGKECTCPTCPVHPSNTTNNDNDSVYSVDEEIIRPSRPRRRGGPRRYISPSPIRIHTNRTQIEETPLLASSATLLSKLNNYDGVADMPYPTRTSVYLTTFPFTDRDIKKYAWLFANGIEEQWLSEPSNQNPNAYNAGFDDGYYPPAVLREPRRSRSPYWDNVTTDLPCIFLSRALDLNVVPEEKTGVRFWIVVQNRQSPRGTKLLVAESRRAAGIVMYYEALSGNSVVFVGAILGKGTGSMGMRRLRVKKAENLEEAEKGQEAGVVGIVC